MRMNFSAHSDTQGSIDRLIVIDCDRKFRFQWNAELVIHPVKNPTHREDFLSMIKEVLEVGTVNILTVTTHDDFLTVDHEILEFINIE